MEAPVVEALALERAGSLKVVKVNLDNEPVLGRIFNVHATPMFVLYKHGNMLAETGGAVPRADLEAWIDSFLVRQPIF
jgi:thioredoxin-like negative regulator of GroEL